MTVLSEGDVNLDVEGRMVETECDGPNFLVSIPLKNPRFLREVGCGRLMRLVFDAARVLLGIGGMSADSGAFVADLMVGWAKEEEKRPSQAAFPC